MAQSTCTDGSMTRLIVHVVQGSQKASRNVEVFAATSHGRDRILNLKTRQKQS